MRIGAKVQVRVQKFGSTFLGRQGLITSVGSGVLPIHVTLEGDNHETDFAISELKEVA
jgi:hypothetical protein